MEEVTMGQDAQRSTFSSFDNGATPVVSSDVLETDADTAEADTYEGGALYPYEVPEEVDIREDAMTVYEWLRRLQRKLLVVDPEFQRNLVWKLEQKSQFIESVLVNIPLPPLYVNQKSDGKYIVVDGLQRTSTLDEFVTDQFALSGLKLLSDLNGRKFGDLKPQDQARIEDRKLLVYVIKPSVPLSMVYDIFHRINTGGTQLTRQEIRNCFYIGKATKLLKELSEQDYFRQAIDNGISPKRMKDREAILRYLAFSIQNYKTEYKNDMDAFLGKAMEQINQMGDGQIEQLRVEFERVMRRTHEFFGDKNFRLPTNSTRGRINIALMEAVCYFFTQKSEEFLAKHKQVIRKNYQQLLTDREFIETIRFSTSARGRVIERFESTQRILGNV
ncbi:MAG: DUF262 domain-containing protein [Caldilineaceae bacterium]